MGFHTVVMLKLDAPELFDQLENVNKIVAKKLMADFEHNDGKNFKDSYSDSMIRILAKAFPNHEVDIATGLNSIDFYLPEHKLCIEIDGSAHFYNLTDHELIKSKSKLNLLKKAGLKVLKLRHHDFSMLNVSQVFDSVDIDESEVVKAVNNAIIEME